MSEVLDPRPIFEDPLIVEQRENREVIVSLQAEYSQIMKRVREISEEIGERWEVDRALGYQINKT